MIKNITDLKKADNFFLLAGPCVIEGEEMALRIAEHIVKVTDRLGIPYVFKGSYRKANRSRLDSFTGIGDEKALKVLEKVRQTFDIPVVTDIHAAQEAEMAAEYVDVLQIPAFLCRQTDLLVAAARTGKIVNIKKGQFLSPEAMRFAAEKVVEAGNDQVMLTERGTTFGYQDLVVDYRGIPEMQSFGYPKLSRFYAIVPTPNDKSPVFHSLQGKDATTRIFHHTVTVMTDSRRCFRKPVSGIYPFGDVSCPRDVGNQAVCPSDGRDVIIERDALFGQ